MTVKIKAVYVEQFGYWWKLTPMQWRELCEGAAQGKGYDLPDSAALKHRPRAAAVLRFPGAAPSYYSRTPDFEIRRPLDWDEIDFRDELASFKEIM